MALIRMDHLPVNIKFNIPLNIIIPEPGEMKGVPVRDRKVLYLLHGLSDDASAWQRYSQIEIFARRYGLVVVMPSVGRSFYIDQPNEQKYFTYVTQELPTYMEQVFGVIPRRENTLIAGISMGGYGALKAALYYPEKYSAVGCFSGVLSLNVLKLIPDDPRHTEFAHLFGDLDKVRGSEHDPEVWLRKAAKNSELLPHLFVYTGRQEDLYPLNVQFNQACRSLGIPVEYHEEDGQHDWVLWNRLIERFLVQVLELGS